MTAARSPAAYPSIPGAIIRIQSYVELLTCLQMAKDVKNLPKN